MAGGLENRVDKWIFQLDEDALTADAISLFLERRISSVPIIDRLGKVKTVLSKTDVMNELVKHPANYLEILEIPAMVGFLQLYPPFSTHRN